MTIYSGGLRVSELVGLLFDLELDEGLIECVGKKGDFHLLEVTL